MVMSTSAVAVGGAAIVAIALLSSCSSSPNHTATTSTPNVVATPSASRQVPAGVPPTVYEAALRVSTFPGNHVTKPVKWIETTFADFERLAAPGSASTPATERAHVYVVQVEGSFVFTGSWTGGGSHAPGPLNVNGMVLPVGKPVPGATGGYETNTPLDLSRIAPVHTFELP